jgi:hypothetical protein
MINCVDLGKNAGSTFRSNPVGRDFRFTIVFIHPRRIIFVMTGLESNAIPLLRKLLTGVNLVGRE